MNTPNCMCYICGAITLQDIDFRIPLGPIFYPCEICGDIHFDFEAYQSFAVKKLFSERDKKILSIWSRNEFERRGKSGSERPLTLGDLEKAIKEYQPKDALEMMDNALLVIDKTAQSVGQMIKIYFTKDYPYYHCFDAGELLNILKLMADDDFIKVKDKKSPQEGLSLTSKGYQRLRELKKPHKDSNQCFVAMWFATEMNDVYETAIKPAIELNDDETNKSGYESIKINDIDHVKDGGHILHSD